MEALLHLLNTLPQKNLESGASLTPASLERSILILSRPPTAGGSLLQAQKPASRMRSLWAGLQSAAHQPSGASPTIQPPLDTPPAHLITMDAASIEEINKVRLAMGIKPLPVPGAAPAAPGGDPRAGDRRRREPAQHPRNPRPLRTRTTARPRRPRTRSGNVNKRRPPSRRRELAQRTTVVEGKGLADDEDEVDVKSWLKNQKKRQEDRDDAQGR